MSHLNKPRQRIWICLGQTQFACSFLNGVWVWGLLQRTNIVAWLSDWGGGGWNQHDCKCSRDCLRGSFSVRFARWPPPPPPHVQTLMTLTGCGSSFPWRCFMAQVGRVHNTDDMHISPLSRGWCPPLPPPPPPQPANSCHDPRHFKRELISHLLLAGCSTLYHVDT